MQAVSEKDKVRLSIYYLFYPFYSGCYLLHFCVKDSWSVVPILTDKIGNRKAEFLYALATVDETELNGLNTQNTVAVIKEKKQNMSNLEPFQTCVTFTVNRFIMFLGLYLSFVSQEMGKKWGNYLLILWSQSKKSTACIFPDNLEINIRSGNKDLLHLVELQQYNSSQ